MRSGILKTNAEVLTFCSKLLDTLCVFSAGYLAYYVRFDELILRPTHGVALLIVSMGSMLVFPKFNLYRAWRGLGIWVEIRTVLFAWLSVIALGVIVAYLMKSAEVYSRLWIGYWIGFGCFILVSQRLLLRSFLKWIRSRGANTRGVLIVGAGESGQRIANYFQENAWVGFRVVGFLDDEIQSDPRQTNSIPVLGKLERLAELTRPSEAMADLTTVDHVWITLTINEGEKIKSVCEILENSAVHIVFVPDIFTLNLFNHSIDDMGGIPILSLRSSPLRGKALFSKAIADYLISSIMIIVMLPLLAVIAVAIKLDSKGPVLFKQRRYGIDGREIIVWKFRTMTVMEDGDHVPQAALNDSRVTSIGAFLRRCSLDELPQFFNVLQGHMSIVGPRPHAVAHNELYRGIIDHYMWRHLAKPGITGLAQVSGFRGNTQSIEKMQERVKYDLKYIREWSILLDIKIILTTLIVICTNKDVY